MNKSRKKEGNAKTRSQSVKSKREVDEGKEKTNGIKRKLVKREINRGWEEMRRRR